MEQTKGEHANALASEKLKGQEAGLQHQQDKLTTATKAAEQPSAHADALAKLHDLMKEMHGAIHAPRETVLEVGPDGKKRGISRIAQH